MNTETKMQYREIAIAQLPECCALRVQIENWVKDINQASVIVVARINILGEWAAYIGYPRINTIKDEYLLHDWVVYHCSTISSKEQVLNRGNMLDPDTASQLFPEWSYRRYRT